MSTETFSFTGEQLSRLLRVVSAVREYNKARLAYIAALDRRHGTQRGAVEYTAEDEQALAHVAHPFHQASEALMEAIWAYGID